MPARCAQKRCALGPQVCTSGHQSSNHNSGTRSVSGPRLQTPPPPHPRPIAAPPRLRPIHYALRTRKLPTSSSKFRVVSLTPPCILPASPALCVSRMRISLPEGEPCPTPSLAQISAWVVAMASERLPSRPACLLVASGASEGEARGAAVWLSGLQS